MLPIGAGRSGVSFIAVKGLRPPGNKLIAVNWLCMFSDIKAATLCKTSRLETVSGFLSMFAYSNNT